MVTETISLNLLYIAPAIWGLAVSLIEMFLLMQDRRGFRTFTHGLYAIFTCLIFSYISMNAPYIGSYLSTFKGLEFLAKSSVSNIIIPLIIGLIATFKIKLAIIVVGRHRGIGERFPHALIIGVLIAIAPFVWPYVVPMLPALLSK